MVVPDLKKHNFEKARESYGDLWLGFGENELYKMIKEVDLKVQKWRLLPRKNRNLFLIILGVIDHRESEFQFFY